MADIKVLDNLVVLNLVISMWTARRKMTAQDLGTAKLPPADLASLGSKRVCDPAKLAVFNTIRDRTSRYLDRVGIRFLGGWAIAEEKANAVNNALSIFRTEYLGAKEDFLKNYDAGVASWIGQHPEWSEMIRNSVVSSDYVRSRLQFDWQMYRVAPPKPEAGEDPSRKFDDTVGKLGESLFAETAKAAKDLWEMSFKGKTFVTHRALGPLRSIHEKLRSLAFVDPNAAPAASIVGEALARTSTIKGKLFGFWVTMLGGVLNMLMNPSILYAHCDAVIKGGALSEVMQSAISLGSPVAPTETEETETAAPAEEGTEAAASAEEKTEAVTKEPENEEPENEEPEEEELADTSIGIPSYGLW